MSTTRTRPAIVAVVAMLIALVSPFTGASPASALSGSEFDAGNIISDANFYNGSAMSEAEIQQFLSNAVGGACSNSNCLANYRTDTPTRTWSFGTCSTYTGGRAESAARIIFKVQQACNLSAKVILVTLQKEQSLITDRAPSDGTMRKAMGYGCPDTSECDSTYYGFFNQVFAAGRQLTWYANPAGSFTSIKVGENNSIRYSPNAACGSKTVLIKNRATAALYYYTPYTPNDAALANLGGIGDACSAYGNRNFWVFYNNWFGSPTSNDNPFGNVEVIEAKPGVFRVAGWVADPNTSDPISVHVYVGSASTAVPANLDRPDVGAAYPRLGSRHGFDAEVAATGGGAFDVCVYAINAGPGVPVLLTCRKLTAMSGSPFGWFDSAKGVTGGVKVVGWAIDPDTTAPTSVHVYVDSVGTAIPADVSRPDLPAHFPQYGDKHGFSKKLSASPGTHRVCAYAINIGPGGTADLGCIQVTVPGGSTIPELGRAPIGNFEALTVDGTTAVASGWALDPDTASPIKIHLYVNGAGTEYTADKARADIGAAYPAYGSAHGFSEQVQLAAGRSEVCAYAINTGAGGHLFLGCRIVGVAAPDPGRAPFGSFEAVTPASGGATVAGWALDPDTADPISIHIYVDSESAAYTADELRPDVAAAYPRLGDRHGYSEFIAMPSGAHQVCVYAINNGAGGHAFLGCRAVTVP